MKSRTHHRQRIGRTWANANSSAGLIRRRASADAKREALAAALPPVYRGPDPGAVWRRVVVLDGADQVLMDAVLCVPVCSARCDQLAGLIDGQRMARMTTATEIGEKVRAAIGKRPSVRLLADMQREAGQPQRDEHLPA